MQGTRNVPDVVLVDGDDLYRELLSANLVDRGFSVSCFADGPSLLEALSNGLRAKIALVDWDLPEMSGFDLLGALKERGIGLPVVFMTGDSLPERELQALDHGAVDFIDKGRGMDVLAHRLQLIIDGLRRDPAAAMPEVKRHGDLTLYPLTARAEWQQRDVRLTVAEYKVVTLLVSESTIQTYRAIYDTVHFAGFIAGHDGHGYTTNVRAIVRRIRKKFLAVDPCFAEIENKHLVGYRWRESKH